MKKVTKSSVDYRTATGSRHCGSCAMFHPRSSECDLVRGVIRPEMVCDKWVKRGSGR